MTSKLLVPAAHCLLVAVNVAVAARAATPATFTAVAAAGGGGFRLSNGLVRTQWLPAPNARLGAGRPLNQTYEVFDAAESSWATLADAGLGVQVE